MNGGKKGGKKGGASSSGKAGRRQGESDDDDDGTTDDSGADEPESTSRAGRKKEAKTGKASKKEKEKAAPAGKSKRRAGAKGGDGAAADELEADGAAGSSEDEDEAKDSEDEGGGGGGTGGAADDTVTVHPPSSVMRKTTGGGARRPRSRPHAENCNEVHVLGQVVGGSGFPAGVACKWFMDHGKNWEPLGDTLLGGQSQVDYAPDGGMAVWCHPIDVHFAQGSVQGWPRLLFQVLQLDAFGRNEVIAYGFVNVPSAVGCFELECTTWRPVGSLQEEIGAFFIGGQPQLTTDNVIFNT